MNELEDWFIGGLVGTPMSCPLPRFKSIGIWACNAHGSTSASNANMMSVDFFTNDLR